MNTTSDNHNYQAVNDFAKIWQGYAEAMFMLQDKSVIEPAIKQFAEIHDALIKYKRAEKLFKRYDAVQDKTAKIVWKSKGAARLLHYGNSDNTGSKTIFLVPSLINRYYVLDLRPDISLAQYLSRKGFNTYIIDWGDVSEVEKDWSCADYITNHLNQAAEYISDRAAPKLTIIGHCMGGMLALALAQLRNDIIDSIGLLACPWDFHDIVTSPPLADMGNVDNIANIADSYIDGVDYFSGEYIKHMFHMKDIVHYVNKMKQFLKLKQGSPQWDDFMAIEEWANNTVDLSREVARDCLVSWGIRNNALQEKWSVNDKTISPKNIRQPCFLAIPQNDRIVPPSSSAVLAEKLTDVTICKPSSGHVGMIVGSKAKEEMLHELLIWLEKLENKR